MSGATPTEEGNRSPSLGGRVESVCDRFEAACKAGRRPPIEDYLGELPEAVRAVLLRALLELELAYRRQNGERPTPEEYSGRFPEHAEGIVAVFSEQMITRREGSVESPDSPPARPAGDADSAGPRYQIRRLHARGGLGEVFVAYDGELGREVALKQIQAGQADHPESRARFVREAEITGRLEHPGIVPVYGLGRDSDGRPYYAMRFIEGKTFKEAIQQIHEAEGPGRDPGERILALRKLLRHFLDVCDAVGFAHSRGVLHRDLKPANIMLGPYGETLVVDWGLAKPIDRSEDAPDRLEAGPVRCLSETDLTLTETGAALGTPQYMSPEQAERRWNEVGPASDLYSLGATLYTLLSGHSPFAHQINAIVPPETQRGAIPPLQTALPGVPRLRALEAICRKAMALQPEDRYASPRALAEDLEHWLADEPVAADREGWHQLLARRARRHQSWMVAGMVTLLLVTVVSVIAWVRVESARRGEAGATKRAVDSGNDARTQRNLAVDVLHQARRATAILTMEKALSLCEQRKISHGLLWLARSLRELPDGEKDLQRVIRSNLAAWGRETHRLKFSVQHPGIVDIDSIAFCPDGRRFMTAGRDSAMRRGEIRFWDASSGEPIGPVLPHPIGIWALVVSPDGKTILSGSGDFGTLPRELRLWEATAEHPSSRGFPHPASVLAAVLSRDGKTVLTGCADGYARVWDAASGKLRGAILSHQKAVEAVALSPDGKIAVTGGIDRTARLWDVSTGKPVGAPMNHDSEVFAVCFSPDGQMILTASRDGTARLWDAGTAQATGIVLRHRYAFRDNDSSLGRDDETREQTSLIKAVAFSPDGKTVLTGSADATARLWDVVSGKQIGEPFLHEGDVNAVAYSSDGEAILTSTRWNTYLWDTAHIGHKRLRFQHPHGVGAVAFSPDGKTILTGTADLNPLNFVGRKWQARLWDASTGTALCDPLPHRLGVVSAAFSPDGTQFLTGGGYIYGGPGEARLWQTATREPIGRAMTYDEPIYAVAFNPDGRTFLTAGKNKLAQLYEVGSAKLVRTFQHPDNVLSAAFSPDGEILLTGDSGGIARLWKVATGQLIGEPVAVFSPAGKVSLAGDGVATPRSGNPATGPRPGVPSGRYVMGVAFSPDGGTFLTGGGTPSSGEARLWETLTRKPTGRIFPHQLLVRPVAFSPDGKAVLTGGGDNTVRLWDFATGRPIGATLQHDNWVSSAAFSPDGRFILTGSRDKTARLWETPAPLDGEAARISLWAEVVSGMELDQGGGVKLLDAETLRKRRLRLLELGGPPGTGWLPRPSRE
jgi:eukaryotic-like serine/threonine-protein kinase